MYFEAPEVDQLAGGVDLGLVGRLRLPEHRRGVERLTPGPGEQLGGAKQDCRALFPRRARPVLPGLGRSGDRPLDLGRTALVHRGEHLRTVVRLNGLERVPGAHLLAADHERDLDLPRLHLGEADAELLALRAPGRVAADGLVEGFGNLEDAVSAHLSRF